MYMCPYSFDLYSNWCGVGIFNEDESHDYFQLMYYEAEKSFRRKSFYYDTDEIRYEGDSQFEVSATMATDHTPDIQVFTLISFKGS